MGIFRKLFQRDETPPPDRATTAPLKPELVAEPLPGEGRPHVQIGTAHALGKPPNQSRSNAHLVIQGGYDGNDMLPDCSVLALADCLGNNHGEQSAALAARSAVRALTSAIYLQLLELEPVGDLPSLHAVMKNAFEDAGWAVKSDDEGERTALTLLLLLGRHLIIGHIGNSRAYLWHQSKLKRLTEDHPVSNGEATPAGTVYAEEQLERVSLLGTGSEPQPDITSYEIRPGDAVLLCSSGLWKSLSDNVIAGALQRFEEPHLCAEALIRAAQEVGGERELTALVAVIPSL